MDGNDAAGTIAGNTIFDAINASQALVREIDIGIMHQRTNSVLAAADWVGTNDQSGTGLTIKVLGTT